MNLNLGKYELLGAFFGAGTFLFLAFLYENIGRDIPSVLRILALKFLKLDSSFMFGLFLFIVLGFIIGYKQTMKINKMINQGFDHQKIVKKTILNTSKFFIDLTFLFISSLITSFILMLIISRLLPKLLNVSEISIIGGMQLLGIYIAISAIIFTLFLLIFFMRNKRKR
jgi:hypothetical protein